MAEGIIDASGSRALLRKSGDSTRRRLALLTLMSLGLAVLLFASSENLQAGLDPVIDDAVLVESVWILRQSEEELALLERIPPRSVLSLDEGWKYLPIDDSSSTCSDSDAFSKEMSNKRCSGADQLQMQVTDAAWCQSTCCLDEDCVIWQWCPEGSTTCEAWHCYTGSELGTCIEEMGWKSSARSPKASTSSQILPGARCSNDYCQPGYRESAAAGWRDVTLPHDLLLENSTPRRDAADKAHGYWPYRKAWYRRVFKMPLEARAAEHIKHVRLDFDGVQRYASVWLNGIFLGSHASGYTPFGFDITPHAIDGENLVALEVDATHPDGWWYDGGGIYRHVTLTITQPVHIDQWGVYLPATVVGTIGEDQRANASVMSRTTVVNRADHDVKVRLVHHIVGPDGHNVTFSSSKAVIIAQHQNRTVKMQMQIHRAYLWSIASPSLYTCMTEVYLTGSTTSEELVDRVQNSFGVRHLRWDANEGFFLNGKGTKIKGFANHQDFAGVGVAVPDSLQAYRVHMMQSMGANAWRTAHNPPTTSLLDQCDRDGMLVWAENHRNKVSVDMVEDMKTMIRRDRNHPSIIMWSLCNEVLCNNFDPRGAAMLKQQIRQLDPDGQSVVTAAMDADTPDAPTFKEVLDVIGINYRSLMYDDYHRTYPKQPLIGSETSSDYSDRSVYSNDETKKKYVSSYDVNFPPWGATAEDAWCSIAERSFIAGGFYWTGFDYKGEPTPYGWPNINSHFGVIDIAGFPKDNFWYHKSVFYRYAEQPVLHILPHWNWEGVACPKEQQNCSYDDKGRRIMDVWVYTNSLRVELLLNNVSLGKKEVNLCRHVAWQVPYSPGRLTAIASSPDEKAITTASVETTGAPVAIAMDVDWPQRVPEPGEACLVVAQLVDEQGRMVPTASAMLNFSISGDAEIIGLGNGDPSSHEADKPSTPKAGSRSAWNGLARVIVQVGRKGHFFQLFADGKDLKQGLISFQPRLPPGAGEPDRESTPLSAADP